MTTAFCHFARGAAFAAKGQIDMDGSWARRWTQSPELDVCAEIASNLLGSHESTADRPRVHDRRRP